MSKRGRSSSGVVEWDIFPEKLSVIPNGSAFVLSSGVLNVTSFINPCASFNAPGRQNNNKATVMELFWIDYKIIASPGITAVPFLHGVRPTLASSPDTVIAEFNMELDTIQYFTTGGAMTQANKKQLFQSATQVDFTAYDTVMGFHNAVSGNAANADTGFGTDKAGEGTIEFQDQRGIGILIAAPTIFLNTWADISTGSLFLDNNFLLRYDMWYRFVEVPLAEYLSIIQSQTQAQRLQSA